MKRFRLRDTLLLLTPVAVLAGFGFLMRSRKPAVWDLPGPFTPYIQGVRFVPVTTEEVFDGYDTKFIVELGARGSRPPWWEQGFGNGYNSRIKDGQLVVRHNGVVRSLGRQAASISPVLRENGLWEAEYKIRLTDIPAQNGEIRFRDNIAFEHNLQKNLPSLWLDTPLRASGMVTKVPAVSHVPKIKLDKISIEPVSPATAYSNGEYWRISWTLHKRNLGVKGENVSDQVIIKAQIVDRKGNDVGTTGIQGGGEDRTPASVNGGALPHSTYYNEMALSDMSGVTKPLPREPLWVVGDLRWNDGWPLTFRIPLRDATGKILFTPRTIKPMFRILSVGVKPVSLTGDSDLTNMGNGNDTWVRVQIQALNPKENASKWNWDADYSPHIETADGHKIWEFKLKGAKQPIQTAMLSDDHTDRLLIAYSLFLKSIPKSTGKLTFKAEISANGCRRVPVSVVVRP